MVYMLMFTCCVLQQWLEDESWLGIIKIMLLRVWQLLRFDKKILNLQYYCGCGHWRADSSHVAMETTWIDREVRGRIYCQMELKISGNPDKTVKYNMAFKSMTEMLLMSEMFSQESPPTWYVTVNCVWFLSLLYHKWKIIMHDTNLLQNVCIQSKGTTHSVFLGHPNLKNKISALIILTVCTWLTASVSSRYSSFLQSKDMLIRLPCCPYLPIGVNVSTNDQDKIISNEITLQDKKKGSRKWAF